MHTGVIIVLTAQICFNEPFLVGEMLYFVTNQLFTLLFTSLQPSWELPKLIIQEFEWQHAKEVSMPQGQPAPAGRRCVLSAWKTGRVAAHTIWTDSRQIVLFSAHDTAPCECRWPPQRHPDRWQLQQTQQQTWSDYNTLIWSQTTFAFSISDHYNVSFISY